MFILSHVEEFKDFEGKRKVSTSRGTEAVEVLLSAMPSEEAKRESSEGLCFFFGFFVSKKCFFWFVTLGDC